MPSVTEVKEVKERNEVEEKNPRTGPVRTYEDVLIYRQRIGWRWQFRDLRRFFRGKNNSN